MSEIQGNKAIEDAAIAWVIELEQRAGRDLSDTRYRGAPADIASPPRLIEVKAFGTTNRGYDLWLEVRQVEEARRNPNFHVYVVENVHQATRPSHAQGSRWRATGSAAPPRQGAALLHASLAGRGLRFRADLARGRADAQPSRRRSSTGA
jgi:hypothetical protein